MMRKRGFTLAEVLITLAIIGVIASITLPSLTLSISAQKNRAALKRTMSVLNNAVKMNEAKYGWNFSSVGLGSNTDCYNLATGASAMAANTVSTCAMFNEALVGETYLGRVSQGTPTNSEWKIVDAKAFDGFLPVYHLNYRLNDGTVFGVGGMTICTRDDYFDMTLGGCKGYIDVNGAKGPNRVVTCSDDSYKFIWDEDYDFCDINQNTDADIFPIAFYDSVIELSTNAGIEFIRAN